MKLTVALALACSLQLPAVVVAAVSPKPLESIGSLRKVGPRAMVRAVVQDSQSFIWAAGDSGSCWFDGFTWRCPSSEPASFLASDRKGGVWAATVAGSIGKLVPQAERLSPVATLPLVTGLAVDKTNTVWVGSAAGLFSLDTKSGQLIRAQHVEAPVVAMATDSSGRLSVATSAAVFLFDDLRVIQWKAPVPVHALTPGPDNSVVVTLDNHEVWQISFADAVAASKQLPVPPHTTLGPMAFDAQERLWMGQDAALLSLAVGARQVEQWSLALDVSMFHVNALLVDNEGSLWVGSDTGLLQVRMDPPFAPLSPGAGEDRNSFVFSVAQSPNGDFWTSTLLGVTRWSGGKPHFYAQAQGLLRPDIRSIAVNAEGDVWVAGMASSVYRLKNDQFVPITDGNGDGAESLLARRKGGVWVGPSNGGLGLIHHGGFEWIFHPSAPGRDRIVDMKEAKDGTLWIATQRDGLMTWRNGQKNIMQGSAGIPRVELFFLHLTREDHLWIGTDGAGLFYFDGQQARQVSTKQGLAHDRVFSMLADDRGNFWLGSPRGVFMVPSASLSAVLQGKMSSVSCIEFGPEDGVLGEPVHPFPPSAIRAADGTLVFATTFGAVRTDPKKLQATTAPRVFVNAITVGSTRVESASEVITTAKPATDVSLELSAPTFKAPHRLRFRYRLQGTNAAWAETQSRRLHFERLPRGQHQIVVQVYHSGTDLGPPSEITVSLVLLAPWHERVVVRLGLLVLLASIIAAAIVAMMRIRRRRTEEAQSAIVAERNRIAHEIHDGLEQGLCGLRLQIESAVTALPSSPETVRESLQRANALVADASVDLRMAIWKLQQDATDTSQLLKALEQRLRRAIEGTAVALRTQADGPSRTVPVTVASHLVAITREAVANTLKYASATEIGLRLDTRDAAELVLEITDNGKGHALFDAPPQPGTAGLGISGMRVRARAINGVFEMRPPDEGGTLIRVRIPLRR